MEFLKILQISKQEIHNGLAGIHVLQKKMVRKECQGTRIFYVGEIVGEGGGEALVWPMVSPPFVTNFVHYC